MSEMGAGIATSFAVHDQYRAVSMSLRVGTSMRHFGPCELRCDGATSRQLRSAF